MTCHHGPHDRACHSYDSNLKRAQDFIAEREKIEGKAATPDAERFEVIEAEPIGPHLVLKVKYPSCKACAYEGEKVMVFLDADAAKALRWRRIDPHFDDPKAVRPSRVAPPPAARFPASADGWNDALDYARKKARSVT